MGRSVMREPGCEADAIKEYGTWFLGNSGSCLAFVAGARLLRRWRWWSLQNRERLVTFSGVEVRVVVTVSSS